MVIGEVLEGEAERIVGPRSEPQANRDAYRWGPVQGLRCDRRTNSADRTAPGLKAHNRRIPLGNYGLFQQAWLLEESVWHKVMRELTTRNYKEVMHPFSDAFGWTEDSQALSGGEPQETGVLLTWPWSDLSIGDDDLTAPFSRASIWW